jgi:rfaE bifunctional protein nucleotidyltransferase chain/domain
MNKILTVKKASDKAAELKKENKKIVVTGGCFDILHLGHVKLFKNARKEGDFLFVLLESDKSVERLKGKNRPVNNQKDRAQILSELSSVDYVVLLDEIKSDKDYDQLILSIKPDVLATTEGDPYLFHKVRQAKKTGAKVVKVLNHIPNKSTSNLAKIIFDEFDL